MASTALTYDLVLLLDAEADTGAHERILGEVREALAAGGELLRDDAWGDRALTYPIAHKATANYHVLQFRAGGPELLERLDRVLRFADEVVRFRIIRLKPGTPEAPRPPAATPSSEARTPAAAAPAGETGAPPAATPASEAGTPPAATPASEAGAPPAAESGPRGVAAEAAASLQGVAAETAQPA